MELTNKVFLVIVATVSVVDGKTVENERSRKVLLCFFKLFLVCFCCFLVDDVIFLDRCDFWR